ncbi:MAG: XTP/dITP diphosphatase [Candidatus Omnitrophica bacterium]|nr:XTP/dITP diphosphatase [Candidatus Omnitrophota bacterium]
MNELVVATTNQGKLREIKDLLSDFNLKITSLSDYPQIPPIEETGQTFADNAEIKALTVSHFTGKLTMGEDSGLEVQALNNNPGVFSSRYSGPGANDFKNNQKLLADLTGVPLDQRQACYQSCVVLARNEKILSRVQGFCPGIIAMEPKGQNGFGYDPLFIIPEYQKTFGELDPSIKARISHRSKALQQMRTFLDGYL